MYDESSTKAGMRRKGSLFARFIYYVVYLLKVECNLMHVCYKL